MVLLVVRAQSNDRTALDRLLRDYQRPLYRHIRNIVRDDEAALDVLQTVLLRIARKLAGLRDPRWFRAWAYRIATREAVRGAKRRALWHKLVDDAIAVEDCEFPAPDSEASDRLDLCDAHLESLSPASHAVLHLHYHEDLTLIEIAEALELPIGTVKSRLAYGLRRLRSLSLSA